jgi:hypothetical protein
VAATRFQIFDVEIKVETSRYAHKKTRRRCDIGGLTAFHSFDAAESIGVPLQPAAMAGRQLPVTLSV